MGQWQWRISTIRIAHVDVNIQVLRQRGRQDQQRSPLGRSVEIKIVFGIANSYVRIVKIHEKGVVEKANGNDNHQNAKVRGHHGDGNANSESKSKLRGQRGDIEIPE